MLAGCEYQYLQSILPPPVPTSPQFSAEVNGILAGINGVLSRDFTSLYHLSACAIMYDEDTARRILPHTPAMFFKPLLQAAISNNFYKIGRELQLVPGSLVQLILNWPQENFVLRDVLPSLPTTNYKFIYNRTELYTSLNEMIINLQNFYEDIIYWLPIEIIRSMSGIGSTIVKRIDVSGFFLPTTTQYDFIDEPCSYHHLFNIFESLKAAYNANDIIINEKHHKVEILCDQRLSLNIKDNFNQLGVVAKINHLNSQRGSKCRLVFKKVVLLMFPFSPIYYHNIISMLNILYHNGTKYIEFDKYIIHDELTAFLYPQLQGLGLNSTLITSLVFLKNMCHLQHLNISKIALRNKLTPLCFLPRGLKFLELRDCGLNGEDMRVLEQSHHTETLLQLDISFNDFSQTIDTSALIDLCQKLSAVRILELDACELGQLYPDLLSTLYEALAALPELSLLSLLYNDFPSRILCSHIQSFRTSMSLRSVRFTVPLDVYVIDDIDIINNSIQSLQSEIHSEINCNRMSVIDVIWQESRAVH